MNDLRDLAEDYVLGVLDAAATTTIDMRIDDPRDDADRTLAAHVGTMRDRLLPLDLTAPDLPLSPGAWERLEAALAEREDRAVAAGDAARGAGTATAPRRGWRLAAIGALAASVLLAATLAWQVVSTRPPAVLVVLLDAGGEAVAVLEAYADNTVRVTPLVGVETEPTQVLQLWTKPDPEGPPVSVGLLETAVRMMVRNPDLPIPGDGQLYEITIEPRGGSPTGLPTGPILGVGNAQAPVLDAS